MPLFRRSDADLVTELSDSRRMMPYIMRKRNESVVFHTMQLRIAGTRAWLREYNRAHRKHQHASLFYLFVYASARSINALPGMNRFVSGGRIYQRKDVWMSFSAKKRMVEDSPLLTVKLKFPPNEPFDECMERICQAVDDGRSGHELPIDSELRLLTRLPGPVLRLVVAAGRWLDRFNILPAALIERDPLFTTIFFTNDGSIGVSNAHHHLYEHGTCSLHAVVGSIKKAVIVDRAGHADVTETLEVGWSCDERINDGQYCGKTLLAIQRIMEDPQRYIGGSDAPDIASDESTEMSHQPAFPHS